MGECERGILSDSHSCLLHPAAGRSEGGEGVTGACSCTQHKASVERDRVERSFLSRVGTVPANFMQIERCELN